MALIDTEGRVLAGRTGKSNQFTGNKKSGNLTFSDHGLAPQSNHTGCWADNASNGRRHVDSAAIAKKLESSSNSAYMGKKYIVMEHQLKSDDRKRQQGKIGLKKLSPFVNESEKPRGKPGSGQRGFTSEQRASQNIQKITHQDPSQLGVCGKELFLYEEKVQRDTRVKEAAAHRQEMQALHPPPNRAMPSTLSTYAKSAPFAVLGGDDVSKGHKSSLRQCPQPRSVYINEAKHVGRSVDPAKFIKVPTPFDTVGGDKPYPEPPVVGQRTDPFAGRGKGFVSGQGQCSMDWDSVVRKRADARPNLAPAPRPDNVIFGNPTSESRRGIAASPRNNRGIGSSLLEHKSSAQQGAAGGGASSQGGVRMQTKHKPTSLW